MSVEVLDTLEDLSDWIPVASGLAQLKISPDRGPHGPAMRLDFDFKGGGGFVVARKPLTRSMPESYALGFAIRGAAPPNRLEVKLADRSGRNVWWRHWERFEPPADWETIRVPSHEIEFAYGPAGGGVLTELGAIELVIVAESGWSGTLWIADLCLEDRTYRRTPQLRASSAQPGHPAAAALDVDPGTSWRSEAAAGLHYLEIDFLEERELGGLIVRWAPDARPCAFRIDASHDGVAWRTVHEAHDIDVERSYVSLPAMTARLLRFDLEAATEAGCGMAELAVQPFEFSRSVHAFFEAVAKHEPRGCHPRWLAGEQSYWTPIGLADGDTCAIMNEEGMIEVDRGTYSIEPFVSLGDRLITWADADISQTLEDGWIPIPSAVWRADGLTLQTTTYAGRRDGLEVLYVRYRLTSEAHTGRARLAVAIRPFQVNPPWQAFGELGGMRRIERLAWDGRTVRVDDARLIVPLTAPDGFGAAPFEQGPITTFLVRGTLPRHASVTDPFGYASGALAFDLDLAPGAPCDVFLAIPFGVAAPGTVERVGGADGAIALEQEIRDWRERLGSVTLDLGPASGDAANAARTAAAQVLVNRDGAALHPGPRRYTRAWIRDGAMMAAALLRVGRSAEACAFVRWYATYQGADGNVPCAVDRNGADPLPEHDSHGQLVFAVMECFRFTRDRAFIAEMWPAVRGAVGYLEGLRATRLGPEFDAPEFRARRGLLPESVSHEGYLAQPVHSYWDDFWALQGYRDAAAMAAILGEDEEARRIGAIADEFRVAVRSSVECTMAERHIDYVPGSVEWADFDPTATANAVMLLDGIANLPQAAVARTFDEYLTGYRRRSRGEIDWNNYSAYEIRIIGALVHLGRRDDAAELLGFFLRDRRPPAWNQWPEITWRNPRSPGHLGDVPHTWIGAEYVLALRSALAYERAAENVLVLAAGVPSAWLEGGVQVAVAGLPTHYGVLDFQLRRDSDDVLRFQVSGALDVPAGGIVLRPPLDREIASVEVNGRRVARIDRDGVTIAECPADVRLHLKPSSAH
jgi:hypothetical protein